MTFEKLSSLIEQNNFRTKTDFIIAIKLFDAENDWPETSFTLDDFFRKLENEIGKEINYHTVITKLESYDLIENAWKIESLTSIKEILEIDIYQDLQSIVTEFEERYEE